jgi:hypothetical protein
MHNEPSKKPEDPRHTPWNKGKLFGSKPPLRTKNVWSIRTKLQVEKRTRDLAMFNLAIDSKLRGCDVVSLKVEDVAPRGMAVDRATVRQRKTGHPVLSQRCETIGISVKGHNDQRVRHCKRRAAHCRYVLMVASVQNNRHAQYGQTSPPTQVQAGPAIDGSSTPGSPWVRVLASGCPSRAWPENAWAGPYTCAAGTI